MPASEWEIEAGFRADGWTPLRDPGGQHRLFYHHAWQVLAIDALPRNPTGKILKRELRKAYWADKERQVN